MKARVILPAIYAALFAAAFGFMLIYSGNAWSAVYAVLLAAPWDTLILRFNTGNAVWWYVALIVSASVNGLILFLLGRWIDSIRTRS